MKKKKIFIAAAISTILCAAFVVYIIWGNSSIVVSEIAVSSDTLPNGFDGFRIAHISDLHSSEFGEGNATLLKKLALTSPDIIVITGDLVDYRHGDDSVGIDFASAAANIAPTYFVSGNHEDAQKNFDDIAASLTAAGVTVLRGASVTLESGGDTITLVGIDDPIFLRSKENPSISRATEAELDRIYSPSDHYTILLAHHPELIELYAKYGFDLVFSGHAHGGQFILPFVGGLYAPGQGIFPKYTQGLHTINSTGMIVSRGLGNSGFPFRFNNRPEIVVATLECE